MTQHTKHKEEEERGTEMSKKRSRSYPVGLVTKHGPEVANDVDDTKCETVAAEEGEV